MQAVKQLGVYLKPYRLLAIIAPLLMVLEVAMDLLQPMIMQYMIDTGIANGDHAYVVTMFIWMIVTAILGLFGGVGCTFFSSKAAIYFATDIREHLFKKMMYIPAEKREQITTGKLMTILTSDIESVQRAFMMMLRIFVRGPLLFLGAVIIVFFTARELFSILLIIVPILIVIMYFFTKYSGVLYRKVQEAMDRLNTKLQENLAGIRVVKAFRREKQQIDQFQTINGLLTSRFIQAEQIVALLVPLTMFIVNLGIVAALWLGVIKLESNSIQIGVILAFINYLTIILNGLMSSSMVLMQIARALPSAERITDVLNERSEQDQGMDDAAKVNGEITFDHVSYRYNETSENVLKDIHFTVKSGQKVGIIGKTGSGKTTLVKLLPRLLIPTEGQVLLDGKNLSAYTLTGLRKQIGFTTQRALLFAKTVRENVLDGNEHASEEDVMTALEQACASEFVEAFDDGVDHQIAQAAGNLSGGQKQRLALARAFIRKPKILILDDTTSALDSISENIVQETITNEFPASTIFIVASKISSVQHADIILVMDDGEIVGKGTHQELLHTNEHYQAIYATQKKVGEFA